MFKAQIACGCFSLSCCCCEAAVSFSNKGPVCFLSAGTEAVGLCESDAVWLACLLLRGLLRCSDVHSSPTEPSHCPLQALTQYSRHCLCCAAQFMKAQRVLLFRCRALLGTNHIQYKSQLGVAIQHDWSQMTERHLSCVNSESSAGKFSFLCALWSKQSQILVNNS